MYPSVKSFCESIIKDFVYIPDERKVILTKISSYVKNQLTDKKSVRLIYICTHNSRRSHLGQVWAAVAARYYNVKNVHIFSGGTEVTAFNSNAINALKRLGFQIEKLSSGNNPLYQVSYSGEEYVNCFSKVYADAGNPAENFGAIMTCTDADEKCPVVTGADIRISTPYQDPKIMDGTAIQDIEYDNRCRQIALECLFVFSQVT
ncbi:protein-tyrosine-phosphatase [Cytophaga hutchinsonii]|uniref:Protein-tyrosine-phosphatase n=1 Tax=Cytophaga hutchinsonii (strain ATCC 33406 / DSM 1761 / CIP 103989 / NBRC 15051 / NCIMB 9469 / D465) TaxID=269798 RepID=A0A6N4SNG4_CYTH3|nr:protein-tyrosine-phosphatase [Cytophaga hutchinsonii]ABG57829.1 protein-tyrosine-phosphatase [Cytophaga hutchinsonii ATCC 33406]SFX06709.1 protein-tyrosine phosphatase [Cytophaga hutchinsonii ATCC 33406]